MKERLYNNIVIDRAQFPPKNISNESREPISVPYLEEKPPVIDISVGRQLFVDDFLIAKTDLKRTEHRPAQYENNPVFFPETPIEKGEQTYYYEHIRPSACVLFSGGMWYDGRRKKFRMWYQASFHGSIAYAESDDGIHFERPEFTVCPGTNVVLPRGGVYMDTNSVVLNHYPDSGEEAEYVMSLYIRPSEVERVGLNLYTSNDGVHWTLKTQTRCAGFSKYTGCDDTSNFSYNPFRKRWTLSLKFIGLPYGRHRHFADGKTLLEAASVSNQVMWQRPDKLDLPHPEYGCPPQLYSFNSVAYESVMLGAYDIWKGPENDVCMEKAMPKVTDVHLGFSRDGFHYSRQADRSPFIGCTRERGTWNFGYAHASNTVCLIHGDELWFYYCAVRGDETMKGDTEETNGMYVGGAIGIARLRRDGFASLDGTGSITTEKLEFDGKYLFVNAKADRLWAELLDEEGNVLPGYERENCIPFAGDCCQERMTWKNKKDLQELAGKCIRIRFYQENGSLYAFWISKKETGESGGYLAGGAVGKEGLLDL